MKTVLITGRRNIGQKLREDLEATGKYALFALPQSRQRPRRPYCGLAPSIPTGSPSSLVSILCCTSRRSNPRASWARIQSRNIDLMLNVLAAAQQHHVRRVVFASARFVVAVQRFSVAH